MIAADIRVGQIIARKGNGKKIRRALLVETVTEARPGIFHITGRSVRISDMVQTNRPVSVLHREGLGEVELLRDVPATEIEPTPTVAVATEPSAPQARFLTAIVAGHPAPMNVVGDWRPINTCKANGWVVAVPLEGGRVGWEITPEGRAVIGATESTPAVAVEDEATHAADCTDAEAFIEAGREERYTWGHVERAMVTTLIVSGEEFSVREVPGMVPRTHIIRRGVRSLCGRVAGAAGYRLDLGLVDCLGCLDRYTEETRPKACATY